MPEKTVTVTIFVLVDEDGNYVIATDAGELGEKYAEEVGEDHGADRRTVKVLLTVPLPAMAEVDAVVTDDDEPASVRMDSVDMMVKKK